MSQFTTPLVVKHIDGRTWEVTERFVYHIGCYPSRNIVTVKQGFRTDFASIPRLFWALLPPTGLYGKAAVIHDWLYREQSFINLTRKWADEIFLEGMLVLGVPKWKAKTMYYAVRAFGWNAWRKNAAKKAIMSDM